jgi:tRNA-splicing ligase RtcB
MRKLVETLFKNIPSGVGSKRKDLRLSREELRRVMVKGSAWAVKQGFGLEEDLEYIEERGCIQGADPDLISDRAFERGRAQLGTLRSGNYHCTHWLTRTWSSGVRRLYQNTYEEHPEIRH